MEQSTKENLENELDALHKEDEEIKRKIQNIYKRSLESPAEAKICEDWIAESITNPLFKSLRFPVLVSGITGNNTGVFGHDFGAKQFSLVKVRPCDKELKGMTFLGIYIGRIARGVSASFNTKTCVLEIGFSYHNPAIWVPELNRIVWGDGSWWGAIKSIDELGDISDEDIKNTWYVKLLSKNTGEPNGN